MSNIFTPVAWYAASLFAKPLFTKKYKPFQYPDEKSKSAPSFRPSNYQHLEITVNDIDVIDKCSMSVTASHFDETVMVQPEYCITTEMAFACRKYPNIAFCSTWTTWHPFDEFRALDMQLRTIRSSPKLSKTEDTQMLLLQNMPDKKNRWWKSFTSGISTREIGINGHYLMSKVAPPPKHRTKQWLCQHTTKKFMNQRQNELHTYLHHIGKKTLHRLLFLDVRALPFMRHFVNFDVGFGAHLKVTLLKPALQNIENPKMEILESHLLDDAFRGIFLCSTDGCKCHCKSAIQSRQEMTTYLKSKHQLDVHSPPKILLNIQLQDRRICASFRSYTRRPTSSKNLLPWTLS